VSKTSDMSYDERMVRGGDMAEQAFVDYAESKGIRTQRYGFNRPPLYFPALPEFIRLTPDYACTYKSNGFLVECKGAGRSKFVNIKMRDMETLKAWSELATLYLFINDTDRKKISMILFDEIHAHVSEYTTDAWDNGKTPFYEIPKTLFEWKAK
jgi:hypothetical protein